MKKQSVLVTVVGMLFASLLALGAGAPSGVGQTGDGEFSALTLELTSPKSELLPLEPLPLTLRLSNQTGRAILGHNVLDFSDGYVELLVGNESGENWKVRDLSSVRSQTEATHVIIKPGQSNERKELLTVGLDKVFPRPGHYTVRAVLHDAGWKDEVTSNPLPIRVLEPQGLDRAAYEYVKSKKFAPYFFDGHVFAEGEGARLALREFVEAYGQTPYADYAIFISGQHHFYRGEYEEARALFSRLEKKPGVVFTERVAAYLKQIKERGAGRVGH